jgi:hypothetical protein
MGASRGTSCVRSRLTVRLREVATEAARSVNREYEPADRSALCLVGVEQGLVCEAFGDEGEFPAEVTGFLDASVHPLGAGWAVNMGRVTGEEDAAGSVAGGVAVMEPEVGSPDGVAQPQAAAGEVLDERLQLGERGLRRLLLALLSVIRWEHSGHAPARRPRERKEEEHPDRAQEGVPDIPLQVAVHLEVGEHERLRVSRPLERDPGPVTDPAVGAIASHQVTSMQPFGSFIPVTERADDVFLALLEADQLDVPLNVDTALEQVLVQQGLSLGLRNEEQERVGAVLEADVEQPDIHHAFAGMHPQLGGIVAALDERP